MIRWNRRRYTVWAPAYDAIAVQQDSTPLLNPCCPWKMLPFVWWTDAPRRL